MVLLIAAMLLIGLVWDIYRHRDELLNGRRRPNPVLRRLLKDACAGNDAGPRPEEDSAAEALEAELSRRVLNRSLTPAEYQRAMSQLIQPDSPSAGTR